MRAKVLEVKADYGVAFDGDGDRLIMVDAEGEIVDGDELLFIIAKFRQEQGVLRGGVVGTLMSNFGLEKAMADSNIDFIRADVGDRYVLAELQQQQWQLGGESSGHILCLDTTSTGDGIVSALQVIAALVDTGESLGQLKKGMSKYPQKMINVACNKEVVNSAVVIDAVKQAEQALNGTGRVLLRPSGTEPLVRVMVEGRDQKLVNELSATLARVVEKSSV